MEKLKLILSRGEIREFIVLLIVIITISFSAVYTNVQTYDPVLTPKTGYADTTGYVRMAKGDFSEVAFLNYRILTPLLVSLVPDFPEALFNLRNRLLVSDLRIAMSFGLVNLIFLIGAALALEERGHPWR